MIKRGRSVLILISGSQHAASRMQQSGCCVVRCGLFRFKKGSLGGFVAVKTWLRCGKGIGGSGAVLWRSYGQVVSELIGLLKLS